MNFRTHLRRIGPQHPPGGILFLFVQEKYAKEHPKGGARRTAPPLEPTPVFSITHRHMPGNASAAYCGVMPIMLHNNGFCGAPGYVVPFSEHSSCGRLLKTAHRAVFLTHRRPTILRRLKLLHRRRAGACSRRFSERTQDRSLRPPRRHCEPVRTPAWQSVSPFLTRGPPLQDISKLSFGRRAGAFCAIHFRLKCVVR